MSFRLSPEAKNTELVKKIDDALKALHENGKYDEIYKKWFKAGK